MKTCKKCNIEKALSGFSEDKKYTGGYKNYCKECVVLLSAEWRKKNPDKQRVASKRWNAANIEKMNEYSKIYMRKWRRNKTKQHER